MKVFVWTLVLTPLSKYKDMIAGMYDRILFCLVGVRKLLPK